MAATCWWAGLSRTLVWTLLALHVVSVAGDSIIFPGQDPAPTRLSSSELTSAVNGDLARRNVTLCPEHVCLSERRRPRVSEDWHRNGCFCDQECGRFGDCCRDAVAAQEEPSDEISCVNMRQYGGVYMVTSCPKDWSDGDVKQQCEGAPELDRNGRPADPLFEQPVTSQGSRLTYRNVFCARCHGDDADAIFWRSRVECPSLPKSVSSDRTNASKNIQLKEGGRWGVVAPGKDGNETFYPCSVDPFMPEEVEFLARRCRVAVSTCSADWTGDSNTAFLCSAYNAYVYDVAGRKLVDAYRNPHCAFCNDVPADNLICVKLLGPRFLDGRRRNFDTHAFSILLDVGDRSGSNDVGSVEVCEEGTLWDPFFRKCRRIGCDDGYRLVNGECEKIKETSRVGGGSIVFPGETHNNGGIVFPDQKPPVSSPAEPAPSQFTTCPKFYLSASEYTVINNSSVLVPAYDRRFSADEFALRDDELVICALSEDFSKFDKGLTYISIILLSISIICLFFHLVVFCLVRDLRNLSGRNLASLCVTLLIAYVCFIAAPYQQPGGDACSSVAMVMYAAFIASFGWMNVMAFDVFSTLRHATIQLRVKEGAQTRRFLLYAVYVTLLTIILVASASSADSSTTINVAYRPGFGTRVCWFSRRRALMVWFAVPLALIMAANVALFLGSTRMVRQTAASTAAISCGPSRVNLRLYARLATICGLSWVVGLVAGWLDFQPLWYAFVILNTLQGVFIFFSFTMAERVRNKVRRSAAQYSHWQPSSARNSSEEGGIGSHSSDTPLTNTRL